MKIRSSFLCTAFLSLLLIIGCSETHDQSRTFHIYGGLDTADVSIGDITRFQVWARGSGERKIDFPVMEIDDSNVTVSEGKEIQGELV